MSAEERNKLERRLNDVLRQLHAYKFERDHRKSPSEPLNMVIMRYEMMADELQDQLCEVDNV